MTGQKVAGERQRVVLTLLAWGEYYVDRLLGLTLPALLAPGNYPCLAAEFDCEIVIVTEQRLFRYIEESPGFRKFAALGRTRLVSVDDLLIGPNSYGYTLTNAFFRVVQRFGAEMTNTFFLFLNADFILADDSYRRIIPLIAAGEHVICSPSYCTNEEEVLPILNHRRSANCGTLAIPKREMAEIILHHLHDTVRGQMIDGIYHYDHVYLYQAYIQPDRTTLLGHQMPIAVVGLRPTVHLESITTFWDWGIVSELCPDTKHCVLGDSDDFLMLELRTENTGSELLRLGPHTPEVIADRIGAMLTHDQLHFGEFPLTLHSADLSTDLEEPRVALRQFRARTIALLPNKVAEHRHSPSWELHHKIFREKEARTPPLIFGEQNRANLPVDSIDNTVDALLDAYAEAVRDAARDDINKFLSGAKHEFAHLLRLYLFSEQEPDARDLVIFGEAFRKLALKHYRNLLPKVQKKFTLPDIVRARKSELEVFERMLARRDNEAAAAVSMSALPSMWVEQSGVVQQRATTKRARWSVGEFGRILVYRLFGRPPHVSIFHPYWSVFQKIVRLLDHYATPQTQALVISDAPDSHLLRLLSANCAKVIRISVADAINHIATSHHKFDLCYCELSFATLRHLRTILGNIRQPMTQSGKILVLACNDAGEEVPTRDPGFIRGAFGINAPMRVSFSGSELSMKAIKHYHDGISRLLANPVRGAVPFIFSALRSVRLAYKANRLELQSDRDVSTMPWQHCTAVTMEIDVPTAISEPVGVS